MHTKTHKATLLTEEGHLLASLLDIEVRNYRRLLRLAWRQNSYMKRQNVDRLESNARDWAKHLPVANESRIARERFMNEIITRLGVQMPPVTVSDLLQQTDTETRHMVTAAMQALRDTTHQLARQNELNRNLAEFCLDLAKEEAEIFKRCVLDDPSGCYGEDARNTARGPGGVIVRQA